MRLLHYRAPYTAARVVLEWLPRIGGRRSGERGSTSGGAARPTPVVGGQRPDMESRLSRGASRISCFRGCGTEGFVVGWGGWRFRQAVRDARSG